MKNVLVILALGFGVSCATAQKIKESEVPAAVKTAQEKHFPGSKVEKWEKEGANYESEFDVKKVETSASYDANGTLLETEIEIKTSELPKAVTDYVTKNLAGKKIKEASKITDAAGKISYEAEVGETDYIFDSNGTLLKKETDKEKDNDKK
ncbi:MAG: PepSY-like domain-containing protein [Bacteroidetes bacterium]|nr:PepSY-like domain-containing protein [Bacteroidota bacterium]